MHGVCSTKTWETVYDSGSQLEETLRQHYRHIFNSESEKDKKQTEEFDGRSDDKGLEVESLEIATVCGQTFLFLGAERTSTIFVFDITVSLVASATVQRQYVDSDTQTFLIRVKSDN